MKRQLEEIVLFSQGMWSLTSAQYHMQPPRETYNFFFGCTQQSGKYIKRQKISLGQLKMSFMSLEYMETNRNIDNNKSMSK